MGTTRLTENMRSRIAEAVLVHRFAKAFAVIAADRAALARAVYDDVLTKKQRETIASLPAGWLVTNHAIAAQFGSAYERCCFSGYNYTFWIGDKPADVSLPMPAKFHGSCAKVYEATHKLSLRHDEIERRFSSLRDEAKGAGNEVKAALAAVGTVQALVKAWPEVEPFCRDITPYAVPLPAIPVAKLNQTFDLPVSEAA